ncbi:ankyrin repeat protein [Colletotrichum chrysophilum]|uniref:Ankyrin repeat protein n=1 Tax=Colletotrichum chrysophilum TaxID=1836956 RepID=A0AAD9AXC0_9PEZI|nr:ankyrin repeat protein [Colletotrichum chrysophilum]
MTSVITVHGIRDDHASVWRDKDGSFWLRHELFDTFAIRQLDYVYAARDRSRVFQMGGVEVEARNLLHLYAAKRCHLPDVLMEATRSFPMEDLDDPGKWEYNRALDQIARLSTTIIFLGCPQKTESMEDLEDELYNLMALPGPDFGLIRKPQSLAAQVADINSRFLGFKLLSRALILNIYSLQDLNLEDTAEKQPNAPSQDVGSSESDRERSSIQAITSPLQSTIGKAMLETVAKDPGASVVSTTTKNGENEGFKRRFHHEQLDDYMGENLDHCDDSSATLDINGETVAEKEGNVNSSTGLDTSRADVSARTESSPEEINLPVARASPFSRYTSCLFNTFECKNRWRMSTVDHAGLVRGEHGADIDYSWQNLFKRKSRSQYDFCKSVSTESPAMSDNCSGLRASNELNRSQFALLSMTPPTRLPNVHMENMGPSLPFLDWIMAHENFTALEKTVGPCTLWIQGSGDDASRTSMISQYLYTCFEQDTDRWDVKSAFHFQFQKFDSRYSGIKHMLAAFLSEITWRMWSRVEEGAVSQRMFRSLEYYHNWSLSDLFKFFTEMRRCKDVEDSMIILSCFDHCVEEERTWFLKAVLEQQKRTDMRHKLVIFTCGLDQVMSESASDMRVIRLSDCQAPLVGYAVDEGLSIQRLRQRIEKAFQKRPILSRLRKSLESLVEKFQKTPYLGHIIFNWISYLGQGSPVTERISIIEKLTSPTPQDIISVILNDLPADKRKLAFTIHQWLKYALEPLTVEALGHALVVSTDPAYSFLDFDHNQLLEDLRMMFSGIVVVCDRFLKFSHDDFYGTILPDEDGKLNHSGSSIHGSLAQACLRYLMHTEVQNLYGKFPVDRQSGDMLRKPLASSGDDLLEYAIRFWAEHYRLCESDQPLDLAIDFFRHRDIRNRWAEAHYVLSNPFTRIHRAYLSSLPLMAGLGLEDVLFRQIAEEKSSRWFQQDVWLAITEAVRNGHTQVVCQLMKAVPLYELGLQDALIWAASSGGSGSAKPLLESIALVNDFSWPRCLLTRAAAFGLDSMISLMIKQGKNLNEINDDLGEAAIHTAITWGQQNVIKLLLDNGVDLLVEDAFGRTPLVLSAELGHADILRMLLHARDSVHDNFQADRSVVEAVACAGDFEVLDHLLTANTEHGNEKNDSVSSILPYAAEYGRLKCCRLLLDKGADPCFESSQGSPLYLLCGFPRTTEFCRHLIEKGARPCKTYPDKEAILNRALRTEDKDLITLLLDHGVELNAYDTFEGTYLKTPLTFAVSECSLETIQFLLEKGASTTDVPEDAESPLFVAAFSCPDAEEAEILLKYKADITWERKSDRWTALHAAYDMHTIMSYLLKHAVGVNNIINKMTNYGTLLMMVARWNYQDTLKVLLEHRPLPDLDAKLDYSPDDLDYGRTALMIAVDRGNVECASLLLKAGAEIDDTLKDATFILNSPLIKPSEETRKMLRSFLNRGTILGSTVLQYIGSTTAVQSLQVLVDMGAQINSVDENGLTPLGAAVTKANVAAAAYLISEGARADIFVPDVGSLLHLACRSQYSFDWDCLKLLKLLIDAGADPTSPGPDPVCEPLLHAVLCSSIHYHVQEKIVQYLIGNGMVTANAHDATHSFPVLAAVNSGNNDIFEYLVRHGAELNAADALGRHTIHYLAGRARYIFNARPIRILAKAGVDIGTEDRFKRTALHMAAGTDDIEVFELVLKNLPNYDINVRDSDGWTPLMWACRSSTETTIIERLVETYKADIWARSEDREWSAMKLACLNGQLENAKVWLQPPEGERERVAQDGSTEVWDDDFHNLPRGNRNDYSCDGCFMVSGYLFL